MVRALTKEYAKTAVPILPQPAAYNDAAESDGTPVEILKSQQP